MAEKLTAERLNKIDHDTLALLFLNLQEQLEANRQTIEEQSKKIDNRWVFGLQTSDRINPDITSGCCWAHACRRYTKALKALFGDSKKKASETIAYQALQHITVIFQEDNKLANLPNKERLKQRQSIVKPLVEAYFAWIKSIDIDSVLSEKTKDGIKYSINQEEQLKVFLSDPEVPLDNNATEGALRSFCLHKHTWKLIDTIEGAKSSAIIYSIVETAKANKLHPFRYLEYVLQVMAEHQDDTDRSFMEELMPWAETLPAQCRLNNK